MRRRRRVKRRRRRSRMTTTTREWTGRKITMFNLQCSPGDGLKVHHVVVSCPVCPQAPGLKGAEHDAIKGPVAGLVLLLHQAYHAGDIAAADPGQEEHYLVEEVRSYLEGSITGREFWFQTGKLLPSCLHRGHTLLGHVFLSSEVQNIFL